MNPNSSQKGMSRPFFVPTLMPMGPGSSLHQQVVMTSGGGVAPVFTTAMGQTMALPAVSLQSLPPEHAQHLQPITMVMQPQKVQYSVPKADLYLCSTSNNASEPPEDENTDNKEKLSLSGLEQTFKDLNSHKIKDSLSSFLPHVPGDFDRPPDTSDTMLRQLLDQRTIGGKVFKSLSGQDLLGFRLLPGPLPEQLRMDPPSLDSKPHKKRKHKHKNIEKGEESEESKPPSSKADVPSDAYTFIKQDTSYSTPHISMAHAPSHTHGYMGGGIMGDGSVGGMTVQHQPAQAILAQSHAFQPTLPLPNIAAPPSQLLPGGGMVIDSRINNFPGKKPKKEKRKNKEKKEKRKEKKKKKDRHHTQDPPGTGPASSLLPHPPTSFNQFSNT